MTVSAYDSFAELPAHDWDTLTVGANIYSTSGFAGVREEALPPEAHARYLLAHDSDGTPVANLEVYSFTDVPHDLYNPGDLLGEVISDERAAHLNARPISVAAGWSEFRGQVPGHVNASVEQRESALGRLTAEALRLAGQAGSSVLAYCYLPLETARELVKAHASDGAVLLLHNVETSIPIGLWADFDDYVAWLPASTTAARSPRVAQIPGERACRDRADAARGGQGDRAAEPRTHAEVRTQHLRRGARGGRLRSAEPFPRR